MNDLKIESTPTGFRVFQNSGAAMLIDINGTPIAHANNVWTHHQMRDAAEEITELEGIEEGIGFGPPPPPVHIIVHADIADMMRAMPGGFVVAQVVSVINATLDQIYNLIRVAKDTP